VHSQWQVFDAGMCKLLNDLHKQHTAGRRVEPHRLTLTFTPSDRQRGPGLYEIDVVRKTLTNMSYGETRRIRAKQQNSSTAAADLPVDVPPLLRSAVYYLQFFGCPQKMALEVCCEAGVNIHNSNELLTRMDKRVEAENAAQLNAAMDASKELFEREQVQVRFE
jgi:hypothetical protein